jgi:hypothetical protein
MTPFWKLMLRLGSKVSKIRRDQAGYDERLMKVLTKAVLRKETPVVKEYLGHVEKRQVCLALHMIGSIDH